MPQLPTYSTLKKQVKLKPGQALRFTAGKGYYAGAKPKGVVKRPASPQDSITTIETPKQIETRVQRMASTVFNRERDAVRAEADRLRNEAEGRRRGMTSAYQEAARLNAGMGADVQAGWEQAANTLQGLAGTSSGAISDALQADVAAQEQALSRVGAAGTGFDARSQAAVEAYRSGALPAEFFTRMGGVGRQYLNEAAVAFGKRGLQEGIAGESTARSEIGRDLLSQVKDLTLNRTKYEGDLREQLLGARGDQIEALAKQQEAKQKLAFDYWKQKTYLDQKDAELQAKREEAMMKATTAQEKLQVDRWYKQNKLAIDNARATAYTFSQGALANKRIAETAQVGKAKPSTKGAAAVPGKWPDAWSQFSSTLDEVLDGEDPRFFTEDLNGNKVLKPKYTAGNNAKVLRDDLMRLVGRPYQTKYPKKLNDLRARAYAKAFAIFSIYKDTASGAPAGAGGIPTIGG